MQEVTVNGLVEVCVPLALPKTKSELKKLCRKLGLSEDLDIEDIAKCLVVDAIQAGLDEMSYRQSCESSVSDHDLELESDD